MSWNRDPGIAELCQYFDRPEIVAGGWTRLRSKPTELKVVLEEIRKCRENFEYCARNYFWITSKEREDIPFKLWPSQELLYEKVKEMKKRRKPQKIIVLKARQLGFSVLIEGLITWRTIFFSNVNSLIVSHAPHHSVYLFGIMQHFLERLPFFLRPMIRSHKIEEGLIFENPDPEDSRINPGLNSRVVVQAANQLTGVGQGYRISAAHCCVAPGTLVRVGSAGIKPIQEVTLTDTVLTSDGKQARVRAAFRSDRPPGSTKEISIWGNPYSLVCTPDHRVLTDQGFVQAGCLGIKQTHNERTYVRYPVRQIIESKSDFDLLVRSTGNGHTLSATGSSHIETRPLNYDWGWFFGHYLAEGSISFNKVLSKDNQACRIVLGIHERELGEVLSHLASCFGDRRIPVRRCANSKTVMLDINESALARFVLSEFGHKQTKTIPSWVWEAPIEFSRGLVAGYLYGDGYVDTKNRMIKVSSIRPAITFQLRDLLASLGYGWSSIQQRDAGLHYGRNCQEIWTLVSFSDSAIQLAKLIGKELPEPQHRNNRKHWKYSCDKRFVDIEVQSVKDGISYEFYDLEVDSDCHDFATIQCSVHNSELADVDDWRAKEIIEADLQYAIAENPETMAFIETTAKGQGRYFHKLWEKCVELGDNSEWMPVFFPAFMEKSRFLAPEQGWRPEEYEERVKEKVSREWLSCTHCGKFLETRYGGRDHTGQVCTSCAVGTLEPYFLSDGQLNYFFYKRLNAQKDLDSLKQYKQELCMTPEEAFQISGVQVFPYDCFSWVEITLSDPIAKGFFDANGAFHGVDAKTGKCPIDGCDVDHTYDDQSMEVWEYPRKDETYTIGVDVAEGIGGDYSVAFVNKVSQYGAPDEQVATFRSNTIDPISFAFPVNHLGRWYNEGLMSIEVNKYDTAFSWVRNQLQYPNLYRWKHIDSTNPNSNKWGWETNLKSRPRLYQTAIKFLKAKMWIIRSKEFYREMVTFQKDDYEDRVAEHDLGAHDDVLMAGMISLYSSHDMDYDENLGFIPIKKGNRDIKTYPWQMYCTACPAQWGSTDPNQYDGCPNCGSKHIRADRNHITTLDSAQQVWQEMASETSEPVLDDLGHPIYELM